MIKNIKNIHAVSTNQIADILHYNDNRNYLIKRQSEKHIIIVIIPYQKHIDILIFLKSLEIAGDFHRDIYLYCIYIIHIHTTSTLLHLHFLSLHWAVAFGFAKSVVHAMSCHLQLIFFLTSQKGDGIAGVDYEVVHLTFPPHLFPSK